MICRRLNPIIFCCVWALLISLAGCGDKRTAESERTKAQDIVDQLKRSEIVLDDPAGEASLARNFYFIFDGSGSMAEVRDGKTKLRGAKEAVREFLTKIPPNSNLGLYVFDSKGRRELVPLGSNNRDDFMQAISEVEAGGGTPLASSIRFGTDQLVNQYKRQLGYGEYRLIVVTDGEASNIPEAALYAARYNTPIYAIGLFVESDHPLRAYAMSYREANNYEDLRKALEETLAELPSFDLTDFEE
jgi:uncharacterized protein with von Willebrand factor type A (vWA) domain